MTIQAIILAAGMGKRLKALTKNNTKCMVKVNGVTLIDRMLHQIDKKLLSRIVIVVGYEGQKLVDYIGTLGIQTPIVFIDNPIYAQTNNIYSLSLAKDWLLKEDTLLFESDLIFEDVVLDLLLDDPRDTVALVDKYEAWMDGTCLKLNEKDDIVGFASGNRFHFSETGDYYKTVNLYKFSRHFSETHYVPFLEAYQSALGKNAYYEQVLRVIAMLDEPVIKAKRLNGQRWYEIDDIQDLDIAESLFTQEEAARVERFQARFGGYWRYPKLFDFCFLVNPYYPPQKMKDELRASFDTLLTMYPSGMRVNSLLAARNFDVQQENILVGNGAAELIKSLMGYLDGTTGFIRPTFDEYPNRCSGDDSVEYIPDNGDFAYSAGDVIRFFTGRTLRNLVIVNPDNPSGNYIPGREMLQIVDWCARQSIRLVVDESFIDFADEADGSLLRQAVLERNPHLFVIKSISKSYGVPGLRLGLLASGDTAAIAQLKKDVAIWNINSFGEFFMQIEEKYKKDYLDGLVKLKAERKRFISALSEIRGLRVVPSQANFVMVELTGGLSAKGLAAALLNRHNILIKDLTDKTGGKHYIRLAIRDAGDNDTLLGALRAELGADSALSASE